MSRSEANPGSNGLSPAVLFKDLARGVAVVGLPFFVLVVYLVLHRADRVPKIKEIAYERTLVLNLFLYWILAAILFVVWRHRRTLGGRLRSLAPALVLMLVTSLFCLGFMEIALRLLRPQTAAAAFERLPSETLHHRNAPNRRSLGMGDQWVETNADGFRTPHDLESFLELEHRVVLLGDSYTFGLGVAEEESVASVMEELLREQLRAAGAEGEVGVLNTGVISYSPLLVRQNYREVVRKYRPTLALMLIDANDIGDDHQYAREIASGGLENPRFDVPPVEGEGPGLCERSAVCRSLGPLWGFLGKPKQVAMNLLGRSRAAYDYYAFQVEVDGVVERNRFFILRHPLETTRPFFDFSWERVEEVAADVRADGADFALVVMPRYFHWNDAESPNNWEWDRYGVDEPHENAFLDYFDEKARGRSSFPVISLLPPFADHSERTGEPLVFDHDPHWNARGHRVAAEALASYLERAGWIEAGLATAPSVVSNPLPAEASERASSPSEASTFTSSTPLSEAEP